MTIDDWLASACADADRRGLADLKPLLASLADATNALRGIDWDHVASRPADPAPSGSPERQPDGAPR
jgi:hypothetical protein